MTKRDAILNMAWVAWYCSLATALLTKYTVLGPALSTLLVVGLFTLGMFAKEGFKK